MITKERINQFDTYLISEEKSENTCQKYLRDVIRFADYMEGRSIRKEDVINYKNSLLEEDYAIRSVNSMLASLNTFFGFQGWTDLRAKSIKLQRQVYCPEEQELSKKEYIRLIVAAKQMKNQRLSLIMQTIAACGIRISELSYITVEAVKSGRAVVRLKGKTRYVFIVHKLQKKLLEYIQTQGLKQGAVFVSRNGKPLGRTNIWRDMKKLCEAANVNPKKVYPHNLRHLFAREFYKMENDIVKLADVLGHSNIDTTRIYIVSTGIEHRRCMENMRLVI